LFARRDPIFAFVFEAALFALRQPTPPFAFAFVPERYTTRAAVADFRLFKIVPLYNARYSCTEFTISISPVKARRDPMLANVFEAA
jgi:hypothetical protein